MCGFEGVTIVTGSKHATQICEYVGDGDRYGFTAVDYAFQPKSAGIADVLKRISHKGTEHGVLLILGDNFFSHAQKLSILNKDRAACWEFDIGDPVLARRFGQVLRDSQGSAEYIVEKPSSPVHGRILTGLYYFPADVFKYVEEMEPSARGELEVTGLLDMYLRINRLDVLAVEGHWMDLGEWPSLEEFISKRNQCGST
jgi:glucose-1-phosphate thymidylyltransferase